jgi:hypothetical protein
VVLDCSDLDRATAFWTAVLGYVHGERGATYQSIIPTNGVGIGVLLQHVPETKSSKNRLHLDLRTKELDAEVARITDDNEEAPGASSSYSEISGDVLSRTSPGRSAGAKRTRPCPMPMVLGPTRTPEA